MNVSMLQFILTNIFMISVGATLYLVARTLPRIADTELEERQTLIDRWVHSEIPEKVDVVLNSFFAKLLRRVKIFTLRIDNVVSNRLKRITTEENGNGKSKIDFKDLHHRGAKHPTQGAHEPKEVAKTPDLSK